MAQFTLNDNDVTGADGRPRSPDAHGQAAMLLVESLVHSLIAHSIISVEDAVEIVDAAAEVKEEVAAEMGDSPVTMKKSLNLLDAIRISLNNDLPHEPTRPWPPHA